MASVRANKDKTGKIVSYRWRACIGRDAITGKQQWSTKTVPPLGQTPAREMKEMQRQADEWEKALKEGTIPLKDDTFRGFLERTFWPLHVLNGEHRPSTVAFYTNMAPRCLEYFGSKKLSAIKKVDIEKFILYLREQRQKNGKPLSEKTIKHFFGFLRTCFLYAEEHDLIRKSPMRGMSPPKQPHKDVEYLDPQQAKAFLLALSDAPTRWQALMQILIYLGLRRGEVCGLQWQDIDFDNGLINISRNVTYTPQAGVEVGEPKTRNSFRTLPIPETVLYTLKRWQTEQAETYHSLEISSVAFVFNADDDPYQPQFPTHITKKVKAFMAAHGFPDASPHDLRHTCGSLMLEAGASVKAVQNFLGHEDPETTLNFYAGTNEESLRKAASILSTALK